MNPLPLLALPSHHIEERADVIADSADDIKAVLIREPDIEVLGQFGVSMRIFVSNLLHRPANGPPQSVLDVE